MNCCDAKPGKAKFNFNVAINGRKYQGGVYTNAQITGTNSNGGFQVILPNNVPQGRYNISIRSFNAIGSNEEAPNYIFKVYLDNLPMINGYNNEYQTNNTLYGVFASTIATIANVSCANCDYHNSGTLPHTQQVSGIGHLTNGLIQIRITNENDIPITIPGAVLTGANWYLVLDFEFLGE